MSMLDDLAADRPKTMSQRVYERMVYHFENSKPGVTYLSPGGIRRPVKERERLAHAESMQEFANLLAQDDRRRTEAFFRIAAYAGKTWADIQRDDI